MEFCLANVLKMIKRALYEPISDEDLANLLISDIVSELDLKSKTNDAYYMDKPLVSKLMNNKINVPIILRSALSKKTAYTENIEMFFCKALIPKLIPEKIDVLCLGLLESYSKYEGFSDAVLVELNTLRAEKKTARLLAYIFRLALSAPNKFDIESNKKTATRDIDRTHPLKVTETTVDNNVRCLQAVIEAYQSKTGNVKGLSMENYPQYKRHYLRQKEAYFAAEAVRHASRDSFLEEEAPFEDLLDESYDGVIETWEKDYPNGFERMETVLSQAVQISMESNLISRETAWVTVRVKKGLCHVLVNEGRIEGWVFNESF